jgi:TfoX/Sxy family transcriptional regulator of competence genes
MKMPRPTDDDRARFTALVPDDARVSVKPMFGNLGAFVNGNMFMGLFGSDVGVKLADEAAAALRAAGGGPFGPEGRPMGGYVTLPPGLDPSESAAVVSASLAYVAALPAKRPKK